MSTNENLFDQTYSQIVAEVFGRGTPNFQMIASPIDFSWPLAPAGQIAPQAYQIVSGMPKWSATSDWSSQDATFFSAYAKALSYLKIRVSPEKQSQYNDAKDQQTRASNAVTQAQTDMAQAYLAAKQNGGDMFTALYPTMKDWIAGPGQSYEAAIAQARSQHLKTIQFVATIVQAQMPPAFQNAMNAVVMPTTNPASSPSPPGWVKVPNGAGMLEWQPDFTIGTTGQDWRAQLTKGSIGQFTVHLDASKSTNSQKDSWAKGSAGYDHFFRSASASGSWQKMDLATSDDSVKVEVSVKSSTRVPVTPGTWYDGGLMKMAALGGAVSIDAPWTATGGSSPLFGKDGLVSTRVAGLVVVFQPSFSITMSSATFQQNKENFEASAGLQIGPFSFGGTGGHSSDYKHSTASGTTFTGESTSEDPQIIGVEVAFPGIGSE